MYTAHMHAPTNTSLLLSSLLLFKYPTGITRVAYSADNKKHTVPGAVDYIIRIYMYVPGIHTITRLHT